MELTLDQIITIGASILSSSIIGAFIAHYNAKKLARIQHEFEYKKLIIQKRLNAYDTLENVLQMFMTSSFHEGTKGVVHSPFMSLKDYQEMNFLLMAANNSLWLNSGTEEKFYEFKQLLMKLNFIEPFTEDAIYAFGEENYRAIATLRTELQQSIKDDYADLYNLEKIMKKKLNNSFEKKSY